MAQGVSEERISQLQQMEQGIQVLMLQKQQLQLQLNELDNALQELQKSSEQPYKMVGGLLLAAEKKTLVEELTSKKEIVTVRLNNLTEQEKILGSKAETLKKNLLQSMSKEGNASGS